MAQLKLSELLLLEDEHYLVINKPAGVVCGPSIDPNRLTLLSWLSGNYPDRQIIMPHRLDRETSGAMIFFASPAARGLGAPLFEKRQLKKTYLALLESAPVREQARLEHFLKKGQRPMKSLVVHAGGDKAILDYELKARDRRGQALVQIQLHTGRFHQIRAQMAAIGHPLAGDVLYGARPQNPALSFSLHCWRLQWCCPLSGRDLDIKAPAPDWAKAFDLDLSAAW